MKIIFATVIFLNSFVGFSQSVYVENLKKGDESHLLITIQEKQTTKSYFAGCNFKEITLLADSTKIRLIGELMSYTSDTSKCFMPVFILSNHYMGKRRPVSKQYNCQIEALVLINYIAFSSDALHILPIRYYMKKIPEKKFIVTVMR